MACFEEDNLIRGMACFEEDNLVLFSHFSASQIWPDKRVACRRKFLTKLTNLALTIASINGVL
jgi:hypothetical protein